MASTLPSPPTTPQSLNPQSDQEVTELFERLDALLASYLELVDTYTKLREDLSKQLSSGFISLAQANRASNLGPGRRYGEDGYDERMKALRVVKIEERTNKTKLVMDQAKTMDEHQEQEQETKLETEDEEEYLDGYSFIIEEIHSKISRNPLSWYGILVPPALRQTQTYFTSAVSSGVGQLLQTQRTMISLEHHIWEIRKQIGIFEDYEIKDRVEDEKEADGRVTKEDTATSKSETSSSELSPRRKHELVSRPMGSRSRVLKID